jgi:uncharacterized protein
MRGTWLHRKLGDRLFAIEMWQPQRARFASGCAIGVFFSMMPLPFQMLAAALIAYLARVNIPAAIACTWISNPFTTPLILLTQYKLGLLLIRATNGGGGPTDDVLELLSHAPLPLLAGAFTFGAILSLTSYPLALAGWDWLSARFLQPRRAAKKKSPAGSKNAL